MTHPAAMPRLARRDLLTLAMAGASLAMPAFAQGPTVTLVVPYGAGSTNDIIARLLAPELGTQLGQTVVVDNRAGAGGTVGIGHVVRARADGTTLALVSASSIPINRALFRNLPFDAARDLALIGVAGSTPNALIVAAESGLATLEALIARAKQPGQPPMRHFSPGNGTSQHLSAAQIARLAEFPVENVTYRGPTEAITGLLAGEVVYGFASVPSVVGLIRDGRLRALGTTGPRPSALPGVPLLATLGYPAFGNTDIWYGIAVQRSAPAPVQDALRRAFARMMENEALRARLTQAGFDQAPPMSAAEADAFLATQITFWAELVRRSGATMD